MSTSSIGSLLSSLSNSNESLSELLGESSTSTNSSSNASENAALQDAVNAILNGASNTSGGGIDVTATVDAILEADAAPEETMQQDVTNLNSQTSALQSLQSDITAFQTSLQTLTNISGDFGGVSVSSSDNDVVSATADNGTAAGTHTISVTQLASTSSDYSASFATPSAQLPTGTLSLQVGSNTAYSIPVDSADGTNTLSGLTSYITQHNFGVNATVITDSSGSRLALESQTSGAAGQIYLTDNTSADYSGTFASASTTISPGSFSLQVGSNAAVPIPVDSADNTNTLTGLASYINNKNLGVAASVVTNASGASLALIPQSSGAAGAITISNDTTGTSGNGLGFTNSSNPTSTYNPASPPAEGGMSFTSAMQGMDAKLTVDGIPVDSSSNTVTGALSGVTLNLSGLTTYGGIDSPVTLQVSPNLTPIATDINNFVSSWNTLVQALNSNLQVNSSGTAGALQGDPSVDLVQEQLLAALSSGMSGNSGVSNLQSIGIEMQDDGTLSVDSSTLNDALQNNFSAVQNLFQGGTGLGETLQTALTALTNTTTGALNVDMNGIASQVTDLNSQISDFQTQLQNQQTQLTAEYTTINTTLEQLPQMLSSINMQIQDLNPTQTQS